MSHPLFIYVFLIAMVVFSGLILIEPFHHHRSAPLHVKILSLTINVGVLWCFWHLLGV